MLERSQEIQAILINGGKILNRYFNNGTYTETAKGATGNFVTSADEETEKYLIDELMKVFPDVGILAEETRNTGFDTEEARRGMFFCLDPLDGTTNFSRRDPNFAISLGLSVAGKTVIGLVYKPATDEMFWAQEDKDDAYLNGQAIKVSDTSNLSKSVLGHDWAWGEEARSRMVGVLDKIVNKVRSLRVHGSAACDLCKVAMGATDAYLMTGLKPWDTAAGTFIVERAGGKVTKHDGTFWTIFDSEILASNRELHQEIVNQL
jgi:myo-inositol-1(or 4)-monophosphatase